MKRGEVRWYRFAQPDKRRPVLLYANRFPFSGDEALRRFIQQDRLITIAACVITPLMMLGSIGCDRKEANDFAQVTKKAHEAVSNAATQTSEQFDKAQALAFSRQFIDAVQARDMESLKKLCTIEGSGEYREIMTCYYDAFAIENSQGANATRRYLADEIAKPDNSPARFKALKALSSYFEAKGSLGTKDVAALVVIFSLESRFPHRGGVLGQAIAVELHLIDPPSTRVVTQNADQ
jgi:hypothetical protein